MEGLSEEMEKNKKGKKSLKDHGIVGSSSSRFINRDCNHNYNNRMVKDLRYGEDNYLSGFSWPSRSYTCSFCKREFRSAQALGGHMNVHRRDRARLRQSPPTPRDHVVGHDHGHCPKFLNLNLSPKIAKPNFTSSSSPTSLASTTTFSCTLPSLVSPSSTSLGEKKIWDNRHHLRPRSADLEMKMKSVKTHFGDDQEFDGFVSRESRDGCELFKNAEIVRLDLEIGLISDSKDDLDLELRLGY